MTVDRARRLAPYFEVQLRLASRMAELTGLPVGEAALRYTNFYRRFGLNEAQWLALATRLEAASGLAAQVAVMQATFRLTGWAAPAPGKERFGCFGFDPPKDGVIRIHFNNRDTDAAGGPLVSAKADRRRAELAAMVRRIVEKHADAEVIAGKSWLYNLEAYRRLFPPAYVAPRAPASGPLRLTGSSGWGQMIDSREAIRPRIRDALVANLATLDPQAPWTAFPLPVLAVQAPLETFVRFFAASPHP